MADKEKLEAIRAEIHRLVDVRGYDREIANDLFTFMDSLPNEPVSKMFAFKSIPRLLEMIEPTDRAKSYVTKLADAFDSEGYYTDAKIVRERLKIMNGEKVAMATMDEEPVSDELEKVVEEIVDPTVLNAYGVKEIANRLRKTMIEPVSEDLEEASKEWLRPQLDKSYANYGEGKMMELTRFDGYAILDAIEFGAKWQKKQDQSTIELDEDHAMLAGMEKMKEQMMAKAIEAVVSQVPCSNEIILYNPSSVDKYYLPQEMNKLGLNKGDKIKLVIIKED